MITGLDPYPAMKPSGVEWLGDVPEHWGVERLGNLLRERGETNRDGSISHVLSVLRERGVIPYDEKGNIGNKKSEDISRYKVVRPNDIVVNCMNVIIGSVGLSTYTGCLSPVYYVLTTRGGDSAEYLSATFRIPTFHRSLVKIGNGILAHRMRIPMELLKCELLPRPPLQEQTAIVRYLDYVDRRISRYIQAKQRLIELLEEQKQAIVHQAVTRGLGPDVPLKPSGVEWLGDVPEHWEVRRLKTVLQPIDDRSSTGDETLLSLRRDYGVVAYDDHFTRPPQSGSLVGYKLVMPDQLVVNRLQANNGLIFCSSMSGLVSPDYSVFEAKHPLEMQFLSDSLRTYTYRAHFRRAATGLGTGTAGFLRLYDDDFLRSPVCLPPRSEQTIIVQHVRTVTAEITAAIDRSGHQIELLNEYRTRLIADIVTGKLDVRAAAADLPEGGMPDPDEATADEFAPELEEVAS